MSCDRSRGFTEAADHLGVSSRTLRLAVEAGKVVGVHPLPDGPWVFNRADLETENAHSVAARARQSHKRKGAIPDR